MSVATLSVWIPNLGQPCTVANDPGLPNPWRVVVFRCDGQVLNWSEGRFRTHHKESWTTIPWHTPPGGIEGYWYDSIPTRDGHVEIEVPPGTYVVRATMHSWFVNGLLYGNWATDHAVVQACAGQDVSVTLYTPSAMACHIVLFDFVLPMLRWQEVIDSDRLDRAIEALKDVASELTASGFEEAEREHMLRAWEQMGRELGEGQVF